jgi:hypothetical protein
MVTIVFPDLETTKEGLGFLIARFSGHVRRVGDTIENIVPEAALEALRREGIPFTVKGMTTSECDAVPLRAAAAARVQRQVEAKMVTIVFPDEETEKKALGLLMLGRFSGHVLRTGENFVPEAALDMLRRERIPFTVKETTNHDDQAAPLRGAVASGVQRRKKRAARGSGRGGA